MMFPLSDLRDPVAFLNGARVPLRSMSGRQTEWIGDDAFYRINDSFERESLRYWRDEDEEQPTGIDEDCARRLSLDLADPDVARWVDSKIAEKIAELLGSVVSRPTYAIINWGHDYRARSFKRTHWHSTGCYVEWNRDGTSRRAPVLDCHALADIEPCNENIVRARAALVRALFGKETPCPS